MDILKIFKRKVKKYEFKTLTCGSEDATEETTKLQNEDWEVAGNATAFVGSLGYEMITIPFKRRIK